MPAKLLPFVFTASLVCLLAPVRAESGGDPADEFLTAYSECQKAEKLEASGNVRAALQEYKQAAQLLDHISQRSPQWNPTILDYRRKRTAEAITRLSARAGGGAVSGGIPDTVPGMSGGTDLGGDEPVLPGGDLPTGGDAPAPLPRSGRSNRSNPAPAAPSDPINDIKTSIVKLQHDLEDARNQLDRANRENQLLNSQLQEATKARQKSDEALKVVQTRADLAEQKLNDMIGKGTASAESLKVAQTALAKAKKDLKDTQIAHEAADEVRSQLAARLSNAEARAAQYEKDKNVAQKASSEAAATIAAAQEKANIAVAAAQKKTADVEHERDALTMKLTGVIKERDDALSQIAKFKEAQKQVDKLVSDNTKLMAQLAETETQIAQFKTEGAQKDAAISDLKKEVGAVKEQLSDAKKQSADYQTHMADIQAKLDATAKDLAEKKTANAAGETERKKMQEENDVLRGIVMREMKEQARRDQTRKLVLSQMDKLSIKSETLLKQIDYLGQPVVKLTAKERGLFKKPQVEIGDNEIALAAPKTETTEGEPAPAAPADANASPAAPAAPDLNSTPPIATADLNPPPAPAAPLTPPPAAAPSTPAPAPATPVPAHGKALAKQTPLPAKSTPTPLAETQKPLASQEPSVPAVAPEPAPMKETPPATAKNDKVEKSALDDLPKKSDGLADAGAGDAVPAEMVQVAQEAKDQFEKNNYREAEKLYEKVLAQTPNNVNMLNNLGVVRFRSGKLKLAEESFKKAIAIRPEDGFSHCTLGIVYYSQQRFDDAVNELTKALAINIKNPTAHNYLGITASQKGWQEAAQKELETATALDPTYADAQFNLAVVFATQQPPNKDNARKYYKRAVELGAEPDSSLEQMLK